MIVMALIVVLASIGLAMHANSQTRAQEAVLKEDLFRMRDAIDQYYADKNMYPASLDALVSDKYLRASRSIRSRSRRHLADDDVRDAIRRTLRRSPGSST